MSLSLLLPPLGFPVRPLPFPFPFTKEPSDAAKESTSMGAGPWFDAAAADPGLWSFPFEPNMVSIKASNSCLMRL